MAYKALLTFDFKLPKDEPEKHQHNNHYNRMKTALLAEGWSYAATSAFIYEQRSEDDAQAMDKIWQGVALVGRAMREVGRLTALSYIIQDVQPSSRDKFGDHPPTIALEDIRSRIFPGDACAGNP